MLNLKKYFIKHNYYTYYTFPNEQFFSLLTIPNRARQLFSSATKQSHSYASFLKGGDTRPDFRLSRASSTALLQLLDQRRVHGWSPTNELLVFLFWLASGSSYRVVSRAFDMPTSTVHQLIYRVTGAMTRLTPHVISVPNTLDAQREVGAGFRQLAGHPAFQWSLGAIDGCHIRIKAPGEPHAQCYRNRKLFPSIQLQAVCDHKARFIDVFVGFPGSVHNSRVLQHSPLYRSGAYPPLPPG